LTSGWIKAFLEVFQGEIEESCIAEIDLRVRSPVLETPTIRNALSIRRNLHDRNYSVWHL
jgi:hypothetical protein